MTTPFPATIASRSCWRASKGLADTAFSFAGPSLFVDYH